MFGFAELTNEFTKSGGVHELWNILLLESNLHSKFDRSSKVLVRYLLEEFYFHQIVDHLCSWTNTNSVCTMKETRNLSMPSLGVVNPTLLELR